MGLYGQDWASYQSETPSTSGLSFVFVKITEGQSYVNPRWVAQRDHAKANGLVWGAYHYPHMANDPRAEADYFLSQVAWQPGDLVVLDWEGYDDANRGVPRSTQAAYKDAWLKYVKERLPNNRVGMYANTDYWRNVDQSGFYGDFLWIATAGRAADDPGIQAPWMFHQYSEAGDLDRDYCHLATAADLRAWALGTQPQQEDDMPEPVDLWAYKNAADEAAARKASGGKSGVPDAYGYLVGTYKNTAAMAATITTLANALGAVKGIDTPALIAAVQKAIADAVVDVDVHVTNSTTNTGS